MADNTVLNSGTGGDNIATADTTSLNGGAVSGVKVPRDKVGYGTGATHRDVDVSFPLPTMVRNDGRTFVEFWALGAAAGTTGTETAITLTKSAAAGAATSSGASLTVTSGKRFRITSITFASRGNATATAQISSFAIRVNTAGATTTSSNIWMSARTATPATALAWDRFMMPFDSEGMEVVGDGTLTFGVTANAVYTTNAPTWDVLITGYEY